MLVSRARSGTAHQVLLMLTLESIKKQVMGEHATVPMIYRWYRTTFRKLQKLGFKAQGHGKFVNGRYHVAVQIVKCDEEYASGFVHVSGPSDPPKVLNLYKMPDVKFITLNRFGKLCKVPAKEWDRNRRSISIAKL